MNVRRRPRVLTALTCLVQVGGTYCLAIVAGESESDTPLLAALLLVAVIGVVGATLAFFRGTRRTGMAILLGFAISLVVQCLILLAFFSYMGSHTN